MRNPKIYIVLTILFFIVVLLVFQYVFSIYEVTYSLDHKVIFADYKSTVTIRVIPVNSFGWKAPFRTSSTSFEIKEGNELVDIIVEDSKTGLFTLRAKNKPGKVVIYINSEHSLLPSTIEITIESNLA